MSPRYILSIYGKFAPRVANFTSHITMGMPTWNVFSKWISSHARPRSPVQALSRRPSRATADFSGGCLNCRVKWGNHVHFTMGCPHVHLLYRHRKMTISGGSLKLGAKWGNRVHFTMGCPHESGEIRYILLWSVPTSTPHPPTTAR